MLFFEQYPIRNYSAHMSDTELFEFCVANQELRIERDADQNILIMAPVGGGSGFYEKDFITDIEIWVRQTKLGISFSSSTGFLLPNGAMRSPDASWLSDEKWQSLTAEQKQGFIPLVPDFVVEVRSPTDSLKRLRNKMLEWIEQGVHLGWLIDPVENQALIYRENGSIAIIEGLEAILTGEEVMPGFEFDLNRLRLP
ncbi:MAG: Uma2 family endonuclease [Bacteroidota bacterium]